MEPDAHVPPDPAPSDVPGGGATGPADTPPPGLRAQLGAVVASFRRLIGAHVALAKTELSEIMAEVGRLVAAGCAAAALITLAVTLVIIGGALFLGEWLFGSIGWGVLHGSLFFLDLGFLGILVGLRLAGWRLGLGLGVALVLGLAIGLGLGTGFLNALWSGLGGLVVPGFEDDRRPLFTAMIVTAIAGAFAGALVAWRRGSSVGSSVALGALVGVTLGALTAYTPGGRVGAALGVTTFLGSWPIIAALDLALAGFDVEAMKARFIPQATMDTVKETVEWVRERTPLGPKS